MLIICKFWLPESSCNDILKKGKVESGIYEIKIGSKIKSVYCDMDSKGGGWTIIQRRGDFGRPKDYFLRNWLDYKDGFGDPAEDFWLGRGILKMVRVRFHGQKNT